MGWSLDRIKTVALTGLVILSLLFSFVLWNTTPNYEPLDTSGYSLHPVLGPSKTVEQLRIPDKIFFHLGAGRHTLIGPYTEDYTEAMALLRGVNVETMTSISPNEEDQKVITNGKAFEYQYGTSFQSVELQNLFGSIKGSNSNFTVKTLILYQNEQGTFILFLGPEGQRSYQGRVTMKPEQFEKMQQKGLSLPNYAQQETPFGFTYYPQGEQTVIVQTFERQALHSNQLAQSFFVDPNITRRIQERDGSVIITDGNRGVQLMSKNKHTYYDNPSVEGRKWNLPSDQSLSKAVEFINDHGGMQGQYVVEEDSSYGGAGNSYTFREYVNGLPILDTFSTIDIRMTGNEVVEMSRGVVYLGATVNKKTVQIRPVSTFLPLVEEPFDRRQSVTTAYLAYAPQGVDESDIELDPVWVIQKGGSSPVIFDAVTGGKWQDSGSWLNGLE